MGFPIDRSDIEAAADRIAPHVRRTPVIDVDEFAFGVPLVLKLELLQHTGSFKPRGAFNRVLTGPIPRAGVIAASGGNHGLAVAHAASRLGLSAEIFVPEGSPAIKLDRLGQFGPGISVTVGGAFYADAYEASMERAAETGAMVIHPYDQPEIIAGQGTMAMEFAGQVPDLDTVVIAVGGGGLAGGAACWFRGDVRIIAVEPDRSCALAAAFEAGQPVDVEVSGVAADSLGARRVGELAFAAAEAGVDRVVTVPDDAIVSAQRQLWDEVRLITEPGGATAMAAITSGGYQPSPGERVGVVICGANTDPAGFAT